MILWLINRRPKRDIPISISCVLSFVELPSFVLAIITTTLVVVDKTSCDEQAVEKLSAWVIGYWVVFASFLCYWVGMSYRANTKARFEGEDEEELLDA